MSKLTEAQLQEYIAKIEALAEGPLEEMQKEVEHKHQFPPEFYQLCKEHDLYRCALPEKYGGYGLSEVDILRVQEAFSRGPGGMRMHLHYAMDLNWRILDDFGSEDLKARYMDKFQDKTIFTCFALTEESGGTGMDLHTTAQKDGDYYILNGEKTLISHTDCCEFAYVIAVTDENGDKDRRLSAFFVPVDLEGYEAIPMPHLMGCRGAGHAKLRFTNVRVPKEYLLGQEGDGLKVAMHALSVSRAHIAVSNLGMAQRMLELSIARAKDRVTFGKPLATRQAIQGYLGEMGSMIHALRTMIYDFGRDFDTGIMSDAKASMCKYFSIETVKKVSDYMLLIFGGIGYFEDCKYGPIERLYRDCRAMWLEEGPPSVQLITAARGLLKTDGKLEYLF